MFPKETRILVVDDMLTMRKIVERCLRELGFSVIMSANDGETAWPMLVAAAETSAPFDLIISDWNMPKMKGIELLKRVRAHEKMKATPFVLVTAEAEKDQIQDALQLQVSGYVIKPFSAASLAEKLKSAYARGQTTAASKV
jgi:two-component system chemotaxis response regulator CheY